MKRYTKFFYILLLISNNVLTAAISTFSVKEKNTSYPKLLIKIPTRSRPKQFFKILDLYYKKLSNEIPYTFLISCDIDDQSMNNPKVITKLKQYKNLYFYFGNNTSKVEAYNADIDKHLDFDIILITSDDLEPIMQNYDLIITENMLRYFPNFDGVLNFNDGHLGIELNTYPIIGKKYYNAFGYAYNPVYKALACDNELTSISKILKKEKYIDLCILEHKHPAWRSGTNDESYIKNEAIGHKYDDPLYRERRKTNFDLDQTLIDEATPKIWSILICTLENRKELFNHIYTKLQQQITKLDLHEQIEVLYFLDNKEYSVGFKRNALLEQSSGKYICYVDDDDVSDDYIETIYTRLLKNPDCVALKGIITFGGKNPKTFIHTIKYNTYFEKNNVYYRPPNHLNPIRRSVGVQFSFPKINYGEDTDWAMQIVRSGLLKIEEPVENPYYFYLYEPTKPHG